jgi:hypothetical protein
MAYEASISSFAKMNNDSVGFTGLSWASYEIMHIKRLALCLHMVAAH